MTNDPCDEWPRAEIMKAVGRETCGCVVGRCACPTGDGPTPLAYWTADLGFKTPFPLYGRQVPRRPGAQ